MTTEITIRETIWTIVKDYGIWNHTIWVEMLALLLLSYGQVTQPFSAVINPLDESFEVRIMRQYRVSTYSLTINWGFKGAFSLKGDRVKTTCIYYLPFSGCNQSYPYSEDLTVAHQADRLG